MRIIPLFVVFVGAVAVLFHDDFTYRAIGLFAVAVGAWLVDQPWRDEFLEFVDDNRDGVIEILELADDNANRDPRFAAHLLTLIRFRGLGQ